MNHYHYFNFTEPTIYVTNAKPGPITLINLPLTSYTGFLEYGKKRIFQNKRKEEALIQGATKRIIYQQYPFQSI